MRQVCLANFRTEYCQQFKEVLPRYKVKKEVQYEYPNLFLGSGVIKTMVLLAKAAPETDEAKLGIVIARNAAQYLLAFEFPIECGPGLPPANVPGQEQS